MNKIKPLPLDPLSTVPEIPDKLGMPSKPLLASKTVWGVIMVLIGALLAAFGYAGDLAWMQDGIQVHEIGMLVALLGWALSKIGQRKATTMITGFIRSK